MRFEPLGDAALLIELGGGIDHDSLRRVRDTVARIEAAAIGGVTDVVAGYTCVAVHYDPCVVARLTSAPSPRRAVRTALETALRAPAPIPEGPPRRVEIPVEYGGEAGPDLAHVASVHGLSPEEVVAMHCAATYTVHMIGFLPGFPYLGGLDPRLATPRRDTPRTAVPAGSVGIGGAQTGIYPFDSPGGWHLIGRTSRVLFDVSRTDPALLHVGDELVFRPVARA